MLNFTFYGSLGAANSGPGRLVPVKLIPWLDSEAETVMSTVKSKRSHPITKGWTKDSYGSHLLNINKILEAFRNRNFFICIQTYEHIDIYPPEVSLMI